MYSKKEIADLKKSFWTSFGQYLKPLPNANGEGINWVNYKTGIRNIYFRMDADNKKASIGIELTDPNAEIRDQHYKKFQQFKQIFHETVNEKWTWQHKTTDEHGKPISRIYTEITGVNIFNKADWPAIISFLKPRLLALDEFWLMVKENFQQG